MKRSFDILWAAVAAKDLLRIVDFIADVCESTHPFNPA